MAGRLSALVAPKFQQKGNGCLTIFFAVLIPVSFATGWINSVGFVAVLSLWALVSGHLSAWLSAKVAAKQESDTDVAEVKQILVDKL